MVQTVPHLLKYVILGSVSIQMSVVILASPVGGLTSPGEDVTFKPDQSTNMLHFIHSINCQRLERHLLMYSVREIPDDVPWFAFNSTNRFWLVLSRTPASVETKWNIKIKIGTFPTTYVEKGAQDYHNIQEQSKDFRSVDVTHPLASIVV